MTRITRFRCSSYTGYGTLEGDSIRELVKAGRSYSLDTVQLLPPCAPSKIVCVGRNYRDHAKELGNEVPTEPLIFLKPPSSLIASGEAIEYPPLSQNVHFEGELGVVIGVRARNVPAAEAQNYIFG